MDSYKITGENLHHAYCLIGDNVKITENLKKTFKKELDFTIEGNPDFWYGEYETLGIDDTRNLNKLHGMRPVASDKKIFVVCANFITEQAQNAMLKMFEEPRGDTHFFLIMPKLGLIGTLKSRMMIIENKSDVNSIIDVERFLKMKSGERMIEIKRLMEEISEEEKSKIEVVKFINSLEAELKNKINFSKDKNKAGIFEEIEMVREYAGEQSPSLKMLLEHLALVIPVEK